MTPTQTFPRQPLRLFLALTGAILFAAGLGGCAALGTPDDPNQPIPPARPSPFTDAATSASVQY